MVRDTNTDIYRGVSYNTPSKLFFVNNTFNTGLFCDQFKRKILLHQKQVVLFVFDLYTKFCYYWTCGTFIFYGDLLFQVNYIAKCFTDFFYGGDL